MVRNPGTNSKNLVILRHLSFLFMLSLKRGGGREGGQFVIFWFLTLGAGADFKGFSKLICSVLVFVSGHRCSLAAGEPLA